MPLSALGLLLLAACLHTIWNLFVKRADEKQVFTWWALLLGALCFSPLLLSAGAFPAFVWPYVLCSALVEVCYFLLLTLAYQYGDFSLVYPMARGAAPVLLALWAFLFLGERPDWSGWLGIGLLVLGLLIVGSSTWWRQRKTTSIATGALYLALGTAVCVSIYSAIDAAAVRQTAPLPYTILVMGLAAFASTPLIVVRYGPITMLTELRLNWLPILLAGIFSSLAYMLVLQAYSFASVSYGGAIREIGVVFAAFIGWRWLGESFGGLRVLGSILIFSGILIIAVVSH